MKIPEESCPELVTLILIFCYKWLVNEQAGFIGDWPWSKVNAGRSQFDDELQSRPQCHALHRDFKVGLRSKTGKSSNPQQFSIVFEPN